MYPTCRTDGVWRSLVARPLWERKVVGSNPATPTITGDKIALWGASAVRLLCKLRVCVFSLPGAIRCGRISACSRTPHASPKETEP